MNLAREKVKKRAAITSSQILSIRKRKPKTHKRTPIREIGNCRGTEGKVTGGGKCSWKKTKKKNYKRRREAETVRGEPPAK